MSGRPAPRRGLLSRMMVGLVRLAVVTVILGGGVWFVAGRSLRALPLARAAAADLRSGVLVQDSSLSEISGCAVSVRNPGVLWVHNDSGDGPKLYALRLSDGALVATVRLSGVTATDWEDMTLSGGRLLVGDIGDNGASRSSVQLLSVAEPRLVVGKTGQKVTLKPVRTTWTYPEGARDAEALLVDPHGTPLIIDKVDGTVWSAAGRGGVLSPVASLKLPLVTGADLIPGGGVLVRTYPFIYRYDRGASKSFESVWSAAPAVVSSPLLPQAEAVCASPDGRSGYTLSEARGGPVRIVPISW